MARKKTIKKRGSKTHGWGAKKKHRGKGSKGGSGYSNRDSRWLMLREKVPERFEKKKRLKPKRKKVRVINVEDLPRLKMKLGKEEINLVELGYDKLLGRGKIEEPVKVIARAWSKRAEEKITKAGGKIIAFSPSQTLENVTS